MIYLKSVTGTDTINIVWLNLIDRIKDDTVPPTDWSWLMEFTNDFTKKSKTIVQVLGNSVNYIKGSNTVGLAIVAKAGGSANPFLQEILMEDMGYYSYKIWIQSSFTNLDVDDALVGNLVQTGKALVYNDTPEQTYSSLTDGNPTNFIHVP